MKLCSNCHSEMEDSTKFCTNCGAKMIIEGDQKEATTASQSPETNDSSKNRGNSSIDTQALQNALQGYWGWLLASWKKPFEAQKTTKYAGLLTLFLESLFFTLGIGHWVQKATSAATNTANNILGAFSNTSSSYNNSYSIGIGFYLTIILTIWLAAVAMIGVAFLIHHAVGKSLGEEKFIDYLNKLSHYSSSILLLTILFFLISLSGISTVSMLVIILIITLISTIWEIAIICGVVELKEANQLDRIYGATITVAICIVIELIALSIVMSQLGDTLGSFFTSLLNGGGL